MANRQRELETLEFLCTEEGWRELCVGYNALRKRLDMDEAFTELGRRFGVPKEDLQKVYLYPYRDDFSMRRGARRGRVAPRRLIYTAVVLLALTLGFGLGVAAKRTIYVEQQRGAVVH